MTEIQSYEDFMQLVSSMRAAQKSYFRTRSPKVLKEAKAFEVACDAYIARCDRKAENSWKQQELY
jgi:hypothetical protein